MADTRRPFIKFETVAVEDRQASATTGVVQYKDVDFIVLIPHGSEGKTELREEYDFWVKKIEKQLGPVRAAGGDAGTPLIVESRFPREWLDEIKAGYAAWKKGEELPVKGTPLKQWAVLPPAMLQNCLSNHIYTIEQLAEASDEAINPVGMGIKMYRNRAEDWVKMNVDSERNRIANEVNILRENNARQEQQIKDLLAAQVELMKRIPAIEPQKTVEMHNARKAV